MFDISKFRLQDMTACSAALRQLGAGASSIDMAADRITRYLYTALTIVPAPPQTRQPGPTERDDTPAFLKHRVATLESIWAVQEQADEQPTVADPALITRHPVAEVHTQRRLLMVDDNPVNQRVAVKMLEKLGDHVDVAGNGQEALTALARHPYNLVFMDCQMPELDGFETTQMIRTHEQPGTRLPVIAMTANVMAGDREHCPASGTDDFVSEPVKSQDLHRVLTQWLPPSDNRAAA